MRFLESLRRRSTTGLGPEAYIARAGSPVVAGENKIAQIQAKTTKNINIFKITAKLFKFNIFMYNIYLY